MYSSQNSQKSACRSTYSANRTQELIFENFHPELSSLPPQSLILLYKIIMRWLRLVGSLETYVFFAKEPYKRDLNSAKETYHFKETSHLSHPIPTLTRALSTEFALMAIELTFENVSVFMGWLRLVGSLKS